MDQSLQATIYVGLNYKVAFSVQVINGGYFHEDGRFTEERTLHISLMNVPKQTIDREETEYGMGSKFD